MSADPARPAPPDPAGNEAGLAKGATIGRYVVLGLLGRGGMGEVYAAYDPELDRKIAVKLLRARGGASTGGRRARACCARRRRSRGCRTRTSSSSTTSGTFQDSVFIAMEFVEGHTLGYWLQAQPRPWREVLDVFLAAGRGLAAAHAAGPRPPRLQARERDAHEGRPGARHGLRPRARERATTQPSPAQQQTLDAAARAAALAETAPPGVDPDATMKLGRRGRRCAACRPVSGGYLRLKLTQTGAMLGTPAYMAPEQFAGTGGDARTDQFAFSVALYEGLYGHRPFAGDDVVAVMANVVGGHDRRPPADSRVPAWIRKILLRGLSTQTDDRFPSMADMLAALAHDPAARRRRWLTAVVGPRSWSPRSPSGTHRLSAGQRAMCAGGPARAATAWGPEQRAAVERAFAASGHKRRRARRSPRRPGLIDRYVGALDAACTREACEATQRARRAIRRGARPAHGMPRRAAVERARADRGARQPRTRASSTTRSAPLARCRRSTAAPTSRCCARSSGPDDPAKRAEVAKLREEVAKVSALASAGRCDQATKVGVPVQRGAPATRVQAARGRDRVCARPPRSTPASITKEALADLEDAVMAAEASRHDEIAIEASAWLGGRLRRPDPRRARWAASGSGTARRSSARFPRPPAARGTDRRLAGRSS